MMARVTAIRGGAFNMRTVAFLNRDLPSVRPAGKLRTGLGLERVTLGLRTA